jgi:hypothetical protein
MQNAYPFLSTTYILYRMFLMLLPLFENSTECCLLLYARNNPILDQHNDQPNDDEHKSDDTGPADGLLEELSDASGRLSSISLIRQGKDLPSPSNWGNLYHINQIALQ